LYLWTPGPLTGSQVVVSPTVTTTYTVTGNIGLCTNSQTVTVNVLPTPTLTVSASSTLVCAAEAVTLNVSGAGSYTWNPGAFTNSVYIVNPLVSTVYTVTGSNSGSCAVTETIAVSVSPGPTITVAATNTSICAGNSVVITPSGASTFTLLPGLQTGGSFTVTPSSSATYTILGSDPVGCAGVATLQIIVNPIPSITITPSSNGICTGNTVTLTASGADTYTWLPTATTGSVFTDSPVVTTVYTVVGTSTAGCSSTATISIGVTPVPTLSAFSSSSLVCQSSSVTLSATGATNYTWNPGALNGGTVIVNPTVTTTYTVEGDNGGCSSSATVEIIVTPGPQDVTASSTGSITCFVFTVGLNGSTTSTNVAYLWDGPSSFTSNIQNPSPISVGGTYTLTVTDLNTGCAISATTAVISNTAVPDFTVTSSGDLGCNDFVTLSANSSASAGITYTWSGPATFTSASQSFTTNVAGEYTVSAFDISSGCVSTLTIAVNSNTDLPVFTATILPATCNGTVSNNDGTILVSGNGVRFDLVAGVSYTGSSTYNTATPIPTTGIISNTLVNPSVITLYTIRIYGSNGCFKDTTLNLIPVNCDNRVFGLTKAAGTPSLVNNLYQISYTVTAVNADISNNLTNVTLNENLNSTFPLPTTYTLTGAPVITSQGSSLTINPLFNGSTEISLTTPSLSILPPTKRDTIVFTVLIDPKGFFGPFVNSVIGFANDVNSLSVSDSSNDGFAWDPDADGNPTNNNIPTVVNLIPNSRIGIAKAAVVSPMLPDNTYDVTYIVTVKNFGNDTLKAVQVRDSLFAKTVPLPAQYTIKTAPSITGTLLTANTVFNGNSDINLLAGTDNLAPGASDTIRFTINIKTDTVTVFRNSATAFASNQFSTAIVRDTSQTGYNPDPNNDGNPNEMDPTVIVLPSSELIIPEVFTPNSDGKNDFFVIKGLNGRKVKMTVFNRWGNKVYENPEYDNTWDGYPNVKTMVIGNDKLPQGTYFLILEFQDKDKEVKTGYVVIQY
jgi:gliding motility-associated-like protein